MSDDFTVGWLQEEFDAMKVDIENMSENEKQKLQCYMSKLIDILKDMEYNND